MIAWDGPYNLQSLLALPQGSLESGLSFTQFTGLAPSVCPPLFWVLDLRVLCFHYSDTKLRITGPKVHIKKQTNLHVELLWDLGITITLVCLTFYALHIFLAHLREHIESDLFFVLLDVHRSVNWDIIHLKENCVCGFRGIWNIHPLI